MQPFTIAVKVAAALVFVQLLGRSEAQTTSRTTTPTYRYECCDGTPLFNPSSRHPLSWRSAEVRKYDLANNRYDCADGSDETDPPFIACQKHLQFDLVKPYKESDKFLLRDPSVPKNAGDPCSVDSELGCPSHVPYCVKDYYISASQPVCSCIDMDFQPYWQFSVLEAQEKHMAAVSDFGKLYISLAVIGGILICCCCVSCCATRNDEEDDCCCASPFTCMTWFHDEFSIVLFPLAVGILGMCFARTGLLKVNSLTSYSSTFGCANESFHGYEKYELYVQQKSDDDDDDDDRRTTSARSGVVSEIDMEYGYADHASDFGVVWAFIHISLILLPGLSLIATSTCFTTADPADIFAFHCITVLVAECTAIGVLIGKTQMHVQLLHPFVICMGGLTFIFGGYHAMFILFTSMCTGNFKGGGSSDRAEWRVMPKIGLFILSSVCVFGILYMPIKLEPNIICQPGILDDRCNSASAVGAGDATTISPHVAVVEAAQAAVVAANCTAISNSSRCQTLSMAADFAVANPWQAALEAAQAASGAAGCDNNGKLAAGTQTCGTTGCAITKEFSGLATDRKVLLSVEQSGDLDDSPEYLELRVNDTFITTCKTSTTDWAKAEKCQDVDVTEYVSSSETLEVVADAKSAVSGMSVRFSVQQLNAECNTLTAAIDYAEAMANSFSDTTTTTTTIKPKFAKSVEGKGLILFGYIAGGIIVFLLGHYGFNPSMRDYELYFLVAGGLLDATTDLIYLNMENFQTPALFSAAAGIMLLPLVVVALSFWPLMQVDYKHQKWRYALIPIEGVLMLAIMPLTCTATIVPTVTVRVAKGAWKKIKSVATTVASVILAIVHKMYVEVEEKAMEKRVAGQSKTVKKKLKFYHKGLFQALTAFALAPVGMLLVAMVGLAATAVVTGFGLAIIAAAPAVTLAISIVAPLGIAVIFSIMAFLRLFVLFPSVWEELYNLTALFSRPAGHILNEWFDVGFLEEDRVETAQGEVFMIYDGEERQSSDLKASTVKYLFVEFILEALPQMIVQSVNNQKTGSWSLISYVSLALSAIIIGNSVIKYGCLYAGAEEVDGEEDSELRSAEEGMDTAAKKEQANKEREQKENERKEAKAEQAKEKEEKEARKEKGGTVTNPLFAGTEEGNASAEEGNASTNPDEYTAVTGADEKFGGFEEEVYDAVDGQDLFCASARVTNKECKNYKEQGSEFCTKHTCTALDCTRLKSSRADFCKRCVDESA